MEIRKIKWLPLLLRVVMILSLLPGIALSDCLTTSGEQVAAYTADSIESLAEESQPNVVEQIIMVNGKESWAQMSKQINIDTTSVKIVGTDDSAEIVFENNIIEFNTDMTLNNIQLSVSNSAQGNIRFFANGHNFATTNTVSSEGNFWLYGGGNKVDVGNTSLTVNGGKFVFICGGSYAADSAASTVYVGENVEVGCVLGGAHGGVTTGNISVTYASKHKADFVIGSSSDIKRSPNQSADVNNPDGSIQVTVCKGAVVEEVNGACNTMVNCKDIYVTVEEGASVLSSVIGGSSTSNNSKLNYTYSIGPANGFGPSATHYTTNADIHVTMNGEGRSGDTKAYSASVIGGAVYAEIQGNIDVVLNGTVEYVYGGCCSGNVMGDINLSINGKVLAGGHNANIEIGDVQERSVCA